MLEALFNVSPGALSQARIEFAWSSTALILALLLVVPAVLAAGGYLPRLHGRRLPALLRALTAALVVLILARPEAMLPDHSPGEGGVAVLLDDSLSMRIEDGPDGAMRGAQAARLFGPGAGEVALELEAKFPVYHHRFAAALEREPGGAPTFGGAVSDPLGALLSLVRSQRLAGVVLVSDGGATPGLGRDRILTRLRGAGVPVHAVGVGGEGPSRDIRVERIAAPPTALAGDDVDVSVWLSARGFDGERVRVSVRDGDVLVEEGEAVVDDGRAALRLPVQLEEPGLRALAVEVHPGERDAIAGNDRRFIGVEVREQPVRVLHFEAEPRFEVKFVRRAMAGDPAVALASLVRTGDNRFLRLGALRSGATEGGELAEGFPSTIEALFEWDVIIIGSAAAADFGPERLSLLREFVARRGGSLLFLGGRNALAEGGYADTPVADLLPVRLEAPDRAFRRAAAAALTRDGARHPVTRDLMAPDGVARAQALPALAVVNPVRRVKPGAQVLLRGEDGANEPIALLAWHRYGAGRVAVLPARDTWRWRMHADIAPDDRTHEVLWRRLVRWLARDVPRRVELTVTPAVAAPMSTVQVQARVRDQRWRAQAPRDAVVTVTTPLGDIETQPLRAAVHANGTLDARLRPRHAGLHELAVAADTTARAALLVSDVGEEFAHPAFSSTLLERVAEATGGSYRAIDAVGDLAGRVAETAPEQQGWQRVALWNAPVVLLLLLALTGAEWWLRRRRSALP